MADEREARSGRFLIRMDPGLHEVLRNAAAAAGTSLNEYCVGKLAVHGGRGFGPAIDVVLRAAAVAGGELEGVMIFGSMARGEATVESDVDVLVVVRRGVAISRELYRAWDAEELTWEGRRVEPHFVHLPEAGSDLRGFWAEIAIDGVVLFESGFELSRRLVEIRSRVVSGELVRRWSNGHPYWVAA